jgi:type I restriction enzyme S subunit
MVAAMSELPTGWVSAPIGKLCTLINGRAFKPTEWTATGVPIVRIQNLNNPQASYNHCRGEIAERHKLQGGELLFAWSGTPGTSFGAHIWHGKEAALNQHIFRVDFDSAVLDKRFFRFAINERLNDLIGVAQGGVGLRHVTKGVFEGTEIAVPPRKEQTRIADKLDTLLARIHACRHSLDAIPALLKRFRQAVLSAAASGELLDKPSVAPFPRVALRAVLAEPLRNGKSVRDGDGIPVLRLTSLKAAGIDLSETKTGDWSAIKDVTRFLVQNGDYLVSRGNGSKELVGRGGLVSGCESAIAFPDTMIRMRPDVARLSPAYLGIVWSSQPVRQQIELAAKTTAGIWKVSQPDLENVRLPLPPVDEQEKIVRRVEALFELADRIEARYTAAYSQVQRLTPLVLAKAFRGELLPQDPSDEPASALLARISAQRESATFVPKLRQPRAPRGARAPKESATMTKSRQDDDVKGKPYLAGHLRRLGGPVDAQALFKASELPVADFYKQLAWEVAQGLVKDNTTTLEPGHAAG